MDQQCERSNWFFRNVKAIDTKPQAASIAVEGSGTAVENPNPETPYSPRSVFPKTFADRMFARSLMMATKSTGRLPSHQYGGGGVPTTEPNKLPVAPGPS